MRHSWPNARRGKVCGGYGMWVWRILYRRPYHVPLYRS